MSLLSELRGIRGASGTSRSLSTAARKEGRVAYVFLLPWLIGLVLLTLGPMAYSLFISFTDYNLIQAPEFTGLDNYARMFQDPRLLNSLVVTFTYVLVSVPLQLIFALLIAMVLDRGMRGLPFYRSVFYLPSLLGSSVAIALLWRQIFGTEGLLNQCSVSSASKVSGGSPTRAPPWGRSSC